MSDTNLKTDYLIVGAGAVGMAFADVVLNESDADIVIVDRHQAPGGHWNDAYPFVRLHQPSAFYGVSSRELGSGRVDQVGLNRDLYELATGAEVSAYFADVMHQQFLPSGRVRYFPMCDYQGEGRFVSMLGGGTRSVEAKRYVDATWLKTSVPSTHTPNYDVSDDVTFLPPNDLPRLTEPAPAFFVIGGGKTAVDTVLWLLEKGADPNTIHWVVPRDAWMLNRKMTQPGLENFERSMGAQADQMEVIAGAQSLDELFEGLEAKGVMLRIDPNVKPAMFHGATVSEAEVELLRRVKHVIRKGKVTAIEPGRAVLTEGEVSLPKGTVFIDCSARAIPNSDIKPIFEGNTITPQTVRSYQPVFSAALVAHVELAYDNDAVRNQLCNVVPLPDSLPDWLHMTAANMGNQMRWSQDQALRYWIRDNRLDGFGHLASQIPKDDETRRAILGRMRQFAAPAMVNLQKLAAAST